MSEYPIVVREIGGEKRIGVEEAEPLDVNLRSVVTEGYERIDLDERSDGEQVGTVVATEDNNAIAKVRWRD